MQALGCFNRVFAKPPDPATPNLGVVVSKVKLKALAKDVRVTPSALRVTLADGREITAPLDWFPRLAKATRTQRGRWRLIGGGIGIHWEEIDEDISVEGLLAK